MKNVKFSVLRVLVNSLDENITDFHTLSGFNLVSRSNSKARTTSSNDLFALNLNQFESDSDGGNLFGTIEAKDSERNTDLLDSGGISNSLDSERNTDLLDSGGNTDFLDGGGISNPLDKVNTILGLLWQAAIAESGGSFLLALNKFLFYALLLGAVDGTGGQGSGKDDDDDDDDDDDGKNDENDNDNKNRRNNNENDEDENQLAQSNNSEETDRLFANELNMAETDRTESEMGSQSYGENTDLQTAISSYLDLLALNSDVIEGNTNNSLAFLGNSNLDNINDSLGNFLSLDGLLDFSFNEGQLPLQGDPTQLLDLLDPSLGFPGSVGDPSDLLNLLTQGDGEIKFDIGSLLGFSGDFGEVTIEIENGSFNIDFDIEDRQELIDQLFAQTPDTNNNENYREDMRVRGFVTGGDPRGLLLNDEVERDRRLIGIREFKSSQGNEGQTWVIIHGYGDNPDNEDMRSLIESIVNATGQEIAKNDRVLAVDWREAAFNAKNTFKGIAKGGNAQASTWIASVAEFVVQALKLQYGITADIAQNKLNLVGHSLGTFVSSEIGRIYRDGFDASRYTPGEGTTRGEEIQIIEDGQVVGNYGVTNIQGNGRGARTITALDPASALSNLLYARRGGERDPRYDLDGRLDGIQTPQEFDRAAVFSRAYNGTRSLAGNVGLATTAHESFQMDFGSLYDLGDEHVWVVNTFANLVNQPELMGNLLALRSYHQNTNQIRINDFNDTYTLPNTVPLFYPSGFTGIIDVQDTNKPTLLIGQQAGQEKNDNIVIGDYRDNIIDGYRDIIINPGTGPWLKGVGDRRYKAEGNDKFFGEGGNDLISGGYNNDTLSGGSGNDKIYGDRVIDIEISEDFRDPFRTVN